MAQQVYAKEPDDLGMVNGDNQYLCYYFVT